MNKEEEVINGRKYEVLRSPDMPSGAYIIVGPPEGLVDEFWTSRNLPIPEPFATNLHNIMYDRKIYTYKDIAARNVAIGIFQEAILMDAQALVELFANFEKETV